MLESIFCWLFGHKPDDEPLEIDVVGFEKFRLAACTRCKCFITFEPSVGWVKW